MVTLPPNFLRLIQSGCINPPQFHRNRAKLDGYAAWNACVNYPSGRGISVSVSLPHPPAPAARLHADIEIEAGLKSWEN